jgi:hypothetical protein
VSYGTAHERIRRGIGSFLQQSSVGLFSWSGQDVTLVPDALWLFCGGERWTVYCVLARHVGDREARIAVCGARRGGETHAGWHAAIEALPFHMRLCTVGVTSDGHGGLERAVRELCPQAIHQRCQFHVLADLLRRLGKKAVGCNPDTQRCWQVARSILRAEDPRERKLWYDVLGTAVRMPFCPERTRDAALWFLRIAEEAVAAYRNPLADIPLTTGSAEAMCKRMRRVFLRVRPTSPAHLQQAMEVFIHLYPFVQCNGSSYLFKSHRNS